MKRASRDGVHSGKRNGKCTKMQLQLTINMNWWCRVYANKIYFNCLFSTLKSLWPIDASFKRQRFFTPKATRHFNRIESQCVISYHVIKLWLYLLAFIKSMQIISICCILSMASRWIKRQYIFIMTKLVKSLDLSIK